MKVSLDEVDIYKLSPLSHNVLPKSTHKLAHTQTANFVCLQVLKFGIVQKTIKLYKYEFAGTHTHVCVCVLLPPEIRVAQKTLEKTLTIAKLDEKFASNLHNEANCQTVCESVCV